MRVGQIVLAKQVWTGGIFRVSAPISQEEWALFVLILVLQRHPEVVQKVNLVHRRILLSLMKDTEEAPVLKVIVHLLFVLLHQVLLSPPKELGNLVDFIQDVDAELKASELDFALEDFLFVSTKEVEILEEVWGQENVVSLLYLSLKFLEAVAESIASLVH